MREISAALKKEYGDKKLNSLFPTMRDELVMQYSIKTRSPAVKRGLRFAEKAMPISRPKAAKNRVTRNRDFDMRKKFQTEKPGRNNKSAKKEEDIKDIPTIKAPQNTAKAFDRKMSFRVWGFVNKYSDVFPEKSFVWIDIPKCIPNIPAAIIKKLVKKE